jgi:hypothetical protein
MGIDWSGHHLLLLLHLQREQVWGDLGYGEYTRCIAMREMEQNVSYLAILSKAKIGITGEQSGFGTLERLSRLSAAMYGNTKTSYASLSLA